MLPVREAACQSVYFNEEDTEVLKLGNGLFYEVGFRRTNGSILYIIDKTTGANLTRGSRDEQLWGAMFPDAGWTFQGGALFSATGSDRFSYVWDSTDNVLTFQYTPGFSGTVRVSATITITASEASCFDLCIELEHEFGVPMEHLSFPTSLVFAQEEIEEVLLPIIPGVILERSFFQENRSYQTAYPGWPGVFSDFVSYKLRSGRLGMYSLFTGGRFDRIITVAMGIIDDDAYLPGSTFLRHNFQTYVEDGQPFTSPTVRIHVGQTYAETIASFRRDNRIDAYPSVREKLGDDFDGVAKSPFLKMDLAVPFSEIDGILERIQPPALLHPLNVHAGGWNREYPDFFPPDPELGSVEELREVYERAQDRGLFMMPYTNPTWWDEVSPTILNELPPLDLEDVSVQSKNGILWDTYGNNSGIVASPGHPFVRNRVERLVHEMTEEIPSDFLFEDQIGARTPMLDLNPQAPSPWSYVSCWMDHTKRHASIGLGTEMGYDRLMETVAFFFGSTRIHKLAIGNSRKWWGDANWRPYPLTSLMAGDKVIFYQHNLPVQTMVINRENFIWNCAFGFSLSYLYSNDPDGNDDWLDVASQFQAHAVSRYAGERMISYDETMPGATRSVFPSATITANWDEDLPMSAGAHSISPEGCLISSTDGAMTAGIFESFHSATLTAGGHFLILERSEDDSIRVWQPRGGDTNIRVRIAAVEEAQSLRCFAVAEDGRFEVPMEVEGEYGTFEWKRYREGERVIQYVIGGRNPSGMQAPPSGAPAEYALEQNYPNPFNPATRVRFSLARSGRILLTVYTIRGEEVETLVSEWKEAGHHEVVWDAGDLPGGIYLYRLRTGAYTETRKLILQK